MQLQTIALAGYASADNLRHCEKNHTLIQYTINPSTTHYKGKKSTNGLKTQ